MLLKRFKYYIFYPKDFLILKTLSPSSSPFLKQEKENKLKGTFVPL